MAFDFGTHKIGVAVGQSITGSASPLPELKARDGQPDWDQVAQLLEQWQPDALVVGVPLLMDGSEYELTQRARKFGQRLHGRFGKPWFAMDERLSSFAARQWNRESEGSRRLVDSLAASLILQSWFHDQWPQLKKDNSP
ncbi:MAG: Holliday junction resolvase RuvX [Pseudomonadota bacterium]|nr:Holliday junction resolvase RuvX [Pseudomonadota bacterium]